VQALKFKTSIPDANFLLLTNLVLYDAGGQLFTGIDPEATYPSLEPDQSLNMTFNTAAAEVMRNHISDVLEFLSDVHTLSKVKSRCDVNDFIILYVSPSSNNMIFAVSMAKPSG
jgi:ATP-dependent exoDNAse (exonuclease V) beta subunit